MVFHQTNLVLSRVDGESMVNESTGHSYFWRMIDLDNESHVCGELITGEAEESKPRFTRPVTPARRTGFGTLRERSRPLISGWSGMVNHRNRPVASPFHGSHAFHESGIRSGRAGWNTALPVRMVFRRDNQQAVCDDRQAVMEKLLRMRSASDHSARLVRGHGRPSSCAVVL